MENDQLRSTAPVWSAVFDTGGMFDGRMSVHEDPDGGPLPFLAVCRDGWGAGAQARRKTLEEARRHAVTLCERAYG